MANVMAILSATLIHEFGWIRGVVMAQAPHQSDGAAATHNAAPAEYVGQAALVYVLGLEIPQRRLVRRRGPIGSMTGT